MINKFIILMNNREAMKTSIVQHFISLETLMKDINLLSGFEREQQMIKFEQEFN